MQSTTITPDVALATNTAPESYLSGVSWGAVFAGAAAASALSLILLILGLGLGLSAISPYSYTSKPITGATIGWLAFMQFAASGIGGYMAGRLRTKWVSVHGDEVHFRDTAHGLLAWAVATLIGVAVMTEGASSLLGGATDIGAAAAGSAGTVLASGAAAMGGAAAANNGDNSRANSLTSYYSDMILRSDNGDGSAINANNANNAANGAVAAPNGNGATDMSADASRRTEINKIFMTSVAAGKLSADDRAYLARLVARRTNLSQAEAERRVDDIYARAMQSAADAKARIKAEADELRQNAAHSALWMFVSLLFGAFIASLFATFGGRSRDQIRALVRTSN